MNSVLGSIVNQLYPFTALFIQLGLFQEVCCLHNGFEGVTQIMSQAPKATRAFVLSFGCIRIFSQPLHLRTQLFIANSAKINWMQIPHYRKYYMWGIEMDGGTNKLLTSF